jgi:hypothetical protein
MQSFGWRDVIPAAIPEERFDRLMALQALAEEYRRAGREPTHAELQALLAERERSRGG